MKIIDPSTNTPYQSKSLFRELAAPSLMGVRQAWNTEMVARGLNPQRLAAILDACNLGDMYAYLTLAEEMEERDPHYASVLGTRKRAISGITPTVISASDSAEDIRLADAIRELIAFPEFIKLIRGSLDALAKGFAVVEIIYHRADGFFKVVDYRWRDPRFFVFDVADGYTLRLRDEQDPAFGVPLAPYKFVCHLPEIKCGLPIRSGLARMVAAAHMCKSYALADWMRFSEVFGLPLRVGKYQDTAKEEDIRTLLNAVANIGSDAAAAIPDSMRIEFVSPGNSAGGPELFKGMAEWLDKQISKAVLGQTMTTDDGSSLAQAQVHETVRQDIVESDAADLERTINRDLIIPYIHLNFGIQKAYPKFNIPIRRNEDLKLLVEALKGLVPMGLKIEQSVIRDKLNLPDPDEGAELLTAPANPSPVNREVAINRASGEGFIQSPVEKNTPDLQAENLSRRVDPIVEDWSRQVAQQLAQAGDLPALAAWLTQGGAWGELPTGKTVDEIAKALVAAELAGRYEAQE